MIASSPIEALHEALGAALLRDLPNIKYWQRDWKAFRLLPQSVTEAMSEDEGPGTFQGSRPTSSDVSVVMFLQTWGSTALGYGGIGGAAMTSAYTVVVGMPPSASCIYFGCGRLAFRIDHATQSTEGRRQWEEDLAARQIAEVAQSGRYA